MARENYKLCAEVYRRNRVPMIHRDHIHSDRVNIPIHHIHHDLAINNCRQVLKDYWAE